MEESNSIWSTRSGPDAPSESRLENALSHLRAFGPRRSRAGTLPSKLPSVLVPPHLGSLALVSPDGTDIVNDSAPPLSRSAVGQPPPVRPATPKKEESAAPITPQTRPRAGSLSSDPALVYSPFQNNIWSSNPNAGTALGAPQAGVAATEETMRSRVRAYTINERPHDMPLPSQPAMRPRAHTLVSSPGFVPFEQARFDSSDAPTSALWVTNVPPSMTQGTLEAIFSVFGPLESVVVIATRRCGYVAFTSTALAIEAQATLNSTELVPGNGISVVAFASVATFQDIGSGAFPMYSHVGSLHQSHSHLQVPHVQSVQHAQSQNHLLPHAQHSPLASFAHAQSLQPSPHAQHGHQHASQSVPTNVHVAHAPVPPASASMSALPLMAPYQLTRRSTVNAQPLTLDEPAPVSVAYVLQTLNADATEIADGIAHLRRAAAHGFGVPITPLAEALAVDPGPDRLYTPAVLRDLRRRLDPMPVHEVETVALDMMHELPVLASDYIGNTVVQVVFEKSRFEVRDMMLRRLAPVFAATGTHKNGTWAVQKMIDLSSSPRHYALIEQAIRPHLVSLLLDQFGNYVVQGCLKFGEPWSDFVYSGIATALARIAPSRFGARAVRAVLESPHTTVRHQRLVATAIVQQISTLAHNPNGSLLVSWLLDSFERANPETHARTHALVAAQLVPLHLVELCTSKLGSSIVLKLAASTSGARVLDALLEPMTDRVPQTLEKVLFDQSGQGGTCVYRLLTSVLAANSLERQVAVNKIRICFLKPGAVVPNHKRLLDEVGLGMLLQGDEDTTISSVSSPPHSVGSTGTNGGGTVDLPNANSTLIAGEYDEYSSSSSSSRHTSASVQGDLKFPAIVSVPHD